MLAAVSGHMFIPSGRVPHRPAEEKAVEVVGAIKLPS